MKKKQGLIHPRWWWMLGWALMVGASASLRATEEFANPWENHDGSFSFQVEPEIIMSPCGYAIYEMLTKIDDKVDLGTSIVMVRFLKSAHQALVQSDIDPTQIERMFIHLNVLLGRSKHYGPTADLFGFVGQLIEQDKLLVCTVDGECGLSRQPSPEMGVVVNHSVGTPREELAFGITLSNLSRHWESGERVAKRVFLALDELYLQDVIRKWATVEFLYRFSAHPLRAWGNQLFESYYVFESMVLGKMKLALEQDNSTNDPLDLDLSLREMIFYVRRASLEYHFFYENMKGVSLNEMENFRYQAYGQMQQNHPKLYKLMREKMGWNVHNWFTECQKLIEMMETRAVGAQTGLN